MSNIKHRAILITESKDFGNNDIRFRKDFKFNGHNFIEKDIFESLKDMDKAGIIDLKKVFNMMKLEYGLNIVDIVDIVKSNDDSWRIKE